MNRRGFLGSAMAGLALLGVSWDMERQDDRIVTLDSPYSTLFVCLKDGKPVRGVLEVDLKTRVGIQHVEVPDVFHVGYMVTFANEDQTFEHPGYPGKKVQRIQLDDVEVTMPTNPFDHSIVRLHALVKKYGLRARWNMHGLTVVEAFGEYGGDRMRARFGSPAIYPAFSIIPERSYVEAGPYFAPIFARDILRDGNNGWYKRFEGDVMVRVLHDADGRLGYVIMAASPEVTGTSYTFRSA